MDVHKLATGVILLDGTGSILDSNAAARRLLPEITQNAMQLPPGLLDTLETALEAPPRPGLAQDDSTTSWWHTDAGRLLFVRLRRNEPVLRLELVDIPPMRHHAPEKAGSHSPDQPRLLSQTPVHLPPRPHHCAIEIALHGLEDLANLHGPGIEPPLLAAAQERIRQHLAPDDHLERFRSCRFLVLASHDTPAHLHALPQQLQTVLSHPFRVAGHVLHLQTSMGVSALSAANEPLPPRLREASIARRQRMGHLRSSLDVYTTAMQQELARDRKLELCLRQGLAQGEFSLVYQPQFELASQRLIGFEALVRWQPPGQPAVSPADFIPLAETLGLIAPLGEWILQAACREAASWQLPLSVSVNISPMQFSTPGFADSVMAACAVPGFSPDRLELEITEGTLLQNTQEVLTIFQGLCALGIGFALDDFGTGYSSLSYLTRFPFQKLKIDQSFMHGIPDTPDSSAIVRTICAMGQSLGLEVIAEGVETEDQRTFLHQAGCQQVQGYLTGRPMPAEQARALIAAQAGES